MRTVNKHEVIGFVGQDPQLNKLTNGNSAVNFSLATSYVYMKGEEKQEITDWHRVVAYGEKAEQIAKLIKKGTLVRVEGRHQYRPWEDKDGNKRRTSEIILDNRSEWQLLGKKATTTDEVVPVEATPTQADLPDMDEDQVF